MSIRLYGRVADNLERVAALAARYGVASSGPHSNSPLHHDFSGILAEIEQRADERTRLRPEVRASFHPEISPYLDKVISESSVDDRCVSRETSSRLTQEGESLGPDVKEPASLVKSPARVGAAPPLVPQLISAVYYQQTDTKVTPQLATKAPGQPPTRDQVISAVRAAGRRHGLSADLSQAVAEAESGYRHDAVSRDGYSSKGVFQLLDSTASTVLGDLGREVDEANYRRNPFDLELNTELGAKYLKKLHGVFSVPTDLGRGLTSYPGSSSSSAEKLAVAAFNAGEGNVAAAQAAAAREGSDPRNYAEVAPFLPQITRNYVARVMRIREDLGRTPVTDENV